MVLLLLKQKKGVVFLELPLMITMLLDLPALKYIIQMKLWYGGYQKIF